MCRQRKALNCWSCSLKIDSAEDSYRCDQRTCGKSYHKYCIEESNDSVFHCPWHFCAECHKRTTLRCNYCCNAFCQRKYLQFLLNYKLSKLIKRFLII